MTWYKSFGSLCALLKCIIYWIITNVGEKSMFCYHKHTFNIVFLYICMRKSCKIPKKSISNTTYKMILERYPNKDFIVFAMKYLSCTFTFISVAAKSLILDFIFQLWLFNKNAFLFNVIGTFKILFSLTHKNNLLLSKCILSISIDFDTTVSILFLNMDSHTRWFRFIMYI